MTLNFCTRCWGPGDVINFVVFQVMKDHQKPRGLGQLSRLVGGQARDGVLHLSHGFWDGKTNYDSKNPPSLLAQTGILHAATHGHVEEKELSWTGGGSLSKR